MIGLGEVWSPSRLVRGSARRHDIEDVDEAGMQRDIASVLCQLALNKVCVECDLMGSNSSLSEDMDTIIWGEK